MASSMRELGAVRVVRAWSVAACVAVTAAACGGAPDEPGGGPGAARSGGPPAAPSAGAFVSGPGGVAPRACTRDPECDDANACTRDACQTSGRGEFAARVCVNEPIAGCQSPTPPPGTSGDPPASGDPKGDGGRGGNGGNGGNNGGADDAVDATCASGGGGQQVFLPFKPLTAPTLQLGCTAGFEWQNCKATMSQALNGVVPSKLYVDLATYTAADRLRILGVDASGQPYVLFDTCRVRTANYSDPTGGEHRPPDDSIRQFTLDVKPGTQSLTYDATDANTPFYLRVTGLCGSIPAAPPQCDFRPAP